MELKPYQRIVKSESEIDLTTERVTHVVPGKGFAVSNFKSPEYEKHVKELAKKRQVRIDKIKANRKKAEERHFNKGKKAGIKEYKNSDAFKKELERAEKRGMLSAKPKITAIERLQRKKAKLAEEQKKVAALEKQLSK